jgi:hypothetical protein
MPPETVRGMTVIEVAKYLRIGPDKIRNLIKTGQLGAINTSMCRSGKPRYVVLPHHLVVRCSWTVMVIRILRTHQEDFYDPCEQN